MIDIGVYRNKKHGQYYLVTGTRLDCTNNSGTYMVDYQDRNGEKFTQTVSEFLEKFNPVCTI